MTLCPACARDMAIGFVLAIPSNLLRDTELSTVSAFRLLQSVLSGYQWMSFEVQWVLTWRSSTSARPVFLMNAIASKPFQVP